MRFFKAPFLSVIYSKRGGSKVWVLRQGTCNPAPNGPNDLKFCMQGAFVGYYWVLVKSRSCDLYTGQSHLEARTGLDFIEVTWTWLDQNSILTHANSMQNFKSFGPLGAELQASPSPRIQTLIPPFSIKQWFTYTSGGPGCMPQSRVVSDEHWTQLRLWAGNWNLHL